ncbi:MAG: hypothetical protein ACR2PZ_25990, partial [Pseudomonadales bacterium]
MSTVAGEQSALTQDPMAETEEPASSSRGIDALRSNNPFSGASPLFFPSGQRKRLFDQLRHLSQWSRR